MASTENLVPWGHALSQWISDELRRIGDGSLSVEDFCHTIDTEFSHGRDEQRNEFMTAVKQLARQVAEVKFDVV
jgi:hypothetical protein